MKRRSQKKNILLLALSVVIALAMVLQSNLSGGKTSLLEKCVKGFFYPAERAAAQVTVWVGDLRDYISQVDALKSDNAALKMEISRLKMELSQAGEAVKENERLKALLNLTQTVTQFNYVAADVISGSSSNYSVDLTIASGSKAGLELGMCVVSQDGYVIGAITSLGADWATVTTILDPTSQISAIIHESSDTGVASGDYTYMSSGKLLLKYLPNDADIHIGDTVMTTGTGGVYPSGLTLGYVARVLVDTSGLSDSAEIAPAADLNNLTQVFIIVSDSDTAGVNQNTQNTGNTQ